MGLSENNHHKPLTKDIILEIVSQTEGWFDYVYIDKELGIGTEEGKHSRRTILSRMAKDSILEKHPEKEGTFRYVQKDLNELDWVSADPTNILPIHWPYGVDDGSKFLALEWLSIFPGSVIVVSGISNQGKTTFMLDTLVENMDSFRCIYMTNEMSGEELHARFSYFDWVKLFETDGKPKFRTISRYDNYQDVVIPGWINFIDYLDPGEHAYMIGPIIDKIRKNIGNGIAIIALQKKEVALFTKTGIVTQANIYGVGGKASEERARVVLHLDRGTLYIKKAKGWHDHNPLGKKYSFNIVGHGSRFSNIKDITDEQEG
jgi:hypothetical protein